MTDEIKTARTEYVQHQSAAIEYMAKQYERFHDPLDLMRAEVIADAQDILRRAWGIEVQP